MPTRNSQQCIIEAIWISITYNACIQDDHISTVGLACVCEQVG